MGGQGRIEATATHPNATATHTDSTATHPAASAAHPNAAGRAGRGGVGLLLLTLMLVGGRAGEE